MFGGHYSTILAAMRTSLQEPNATFGGASSAATPGTTSLGPGINSDNSQVPTLGPQRTPDPTTQFCQLCLSIQIRRVHSKGHHFERRIKFPLNTCLVEQESEETAQASLFPEGCPELVVKHSQETADEGTMTSH